IIIFGFPLALACMSFARPIRIGLGIGAVLLMHSLYTYQHDRGTIHRSRSYFGAISVKEQTIPLEWDRERRDFTYISLIHGHINHGMNFLRPGNKEDVGNPSKDLSRLATTYYHRDGPVGRVMEKFNWFPGKANTFDSDVRIGASLVG